GNTVERGGGQDVLVSAAGASGEVRPPEQEGKAAGGVLRRSVPAGQVAGQGCEHRGGDVVAFPGGQVAAQFGGGDGHCSVQASLERGHGLPPHRSETHALIPFTRAGKAERSGTSPSAGRRAGRPVRSASPPPRCPAAGWRRGRPSCPSGRETGEPAAIPLRPRALRGAEAAG